MAELDAAEKKRQLDELRQRVATLERELDNNQEVGSAAWGGRYYLAYYATTGFFLGMIGACTSLLFNVVGSVAVGQHPLQLIKVYLTFGLGERALSADVDNGLILVVGVCLYLGTGMLLGVPFQVILTRFAAQASFTGRLLVASLVALAIWVINFYGIISWLQPLWFGGNWILTSIPVWVAILTHLVFGWTMALIYPWGLYEPYRVQTEES